MNEKMGIPPEKKEGGRKKLENRVEINPDRFEENSMIKEKREKGTERFLELFDNKEYTSICQVLAGIASASEWNWVTNEEKKKIVEENFSFFDNDDFCAALESFIERWGISGYEVRSLAVYFPEKVKEILDKFWGGDDGLKMKYKEADDFSNFYFPDLSFWKQFYPEEMEEIVDEKYKEHEDLMVLSRQMLSTWGADNGAMSREESIIYKYGFITENMKKRLIENKDSFSVEEALGRSREISERTLDGDFTDYNKLCRFFGFENLINDKEEKIHERLQKNFLRYFKEETSEINKFYWADVVFKDVEKIDKENKDFFKENKEKVLDMFEKAIYDMHLLAYTIVSKDVIPKKDLVDVIEKIKDEIKDDGGKKGLKLFVDNVQKKIE